MVDTVFLVSVSSLFYCLYGQFLTFNLVGTHHPLTILHLCSYNCSFRLWLTAIIISLGLCQVFHFVQHSSLLAWPLIVPPSLQLVFHWFIQHSLFFSCTSSVSVASLILLAWHSLVIAFTLNLTYPTSHPCTQNIATAPCNKCHYFAACISTMADFFELQLHEFQKLRSRFLYRAMIPHKNCLHVPHPGQLNWPVRSHNILWLWYPANMLYKCKYMSREEEVDKRKLEEFEICNINECNKGHIYGQHVCQFFSRS